MNIDDSNPLQNTRFRRNSAPKTSRAQLGESLLSILGAHFRHGGAHGVAQLLGETHGFDDLLRLLENHLRLGAARAVGSYGGMFQAIRILKV